MPVVTGALMAELLGGWFTRIIFFLEISTEFIRACSYPQWTRRLSNERPTMMLMIECQSWQPDVWQWNKHYSEWMKAFQRVQQISCEIEPFGGFPDSDPRNRHPILLISLIAHESRWSGNLILFHWVTLVEATLSHSYENLVGRHRQLLSYISAAPTT